MHRTMTLKGFILILFLILAVFLVFHLLMKGDLTRKAEQEESLREALAQLQEEEKDLKKTAELCSNVLELVTGPMVPQISAVEAFFLKEGALAARMSGSGPSVFAIYDSGERAAAALEAFRKSPVSEGCFGTLTTFFSREGKD